MNKTERRTIDRAWECIKKHPELGRVYKKDLVALESYETNGLIRTALVRDRYSKRDIWTGENERTYYEAYVMEQNEAV
jgi:hypothetical protein